MSELDDWAASVARVYDGRTVSGLVIEQIPELSGSAWTLDGYSFVFWHHFEVKFGPDEDDQELAKALVEAHRFECVGDFIDRPDEQLDLLAAFGLILIDRLARLAQKGGSGWEALPLYDSIAECSQYVQHRLLATLMPTADSKFVATELVRLASRRAARKKHEKNNRVRAIVEDEWIKHAAAYDHNKSAFSRDYVRRVSNEYGVRITEKTMREVWLANTPAAGRSAGLPAGRE